MVGPNSAVGWTVGDRYRVVGTLGTGGMGIVYDAIEIDTGLPVAVKVLFAERMKNPSAFRRFKREARALGEIDIPQVCRVFDVGVLGTGEPYFVMERVEGETLRACLDRAGSLSFDEALWIVSEILVALSAAHSLGMVHRDVKPENIIVMWPRDGQRPSIKLIDFGVAKLRRIDKRAMGDDTAANVTLTKAGTVIGTMWYVSPEQARGEEVEASTDVWSVGVVFYEMLTGRKPFDSERVVTLIAKIVRGVHELPSTHRVDMPSWIEAMIERAITQDRKKRYADAHAFREALLYAWHGHGTPTETAAFVEPSAADALDLDTTLGRNELPKMYTTGELDAEPTAVKDTVFDSDPPPDEDTQQWVRES